MAFLIGLNLLWIIWLGIRFRDVRKNPPKYDSFPNYRTYVNSCWYWPLNKPYGRSNPPSECRIVTIFYLTATLTWYWYSTLFFFWIEFPKKRDAIRFLHIGGWENGITIILTLIYCFIMGIYLPLFSNSAIAICNNIFGLFRHCSRSVKWKRMTIIVMIVSLLLFPFRICSIHNGGYVSGTEIVYYSFWSLKPETYTYDHLKETKRVYDRQGERTIHYYIVNETGDELDIYGGNLAIDGERNNSDTFERYLIELIEHAVNESSAGE